MECRRRYAFAMVIAALTTHVAAVRQGLPFDCAVGYANWQTAWSDEKKAWCCADVDSQLASIGTAASAGCIVSKAQLSAVATSMPGAPVGHAPQVPPQEDVPGKYEALKEAAEMASSAPTPAAAQAPSPPHVPPPGWPECQQACEFDGIHDTCAGQVKRVALKTFLGTPDACEDAHRIVHQQCPYCAECSVEDSGCDTPTDSTQQPTLEPEVPPPPPPPPPVFKRMASPPPPPPPQVASSCEGTCVFEGRSASCREQVKWVSLQNFGNRPGSCAEAHDMVAKVCPHCSQCSLASVGCPPRSWHPSPPVMTSSVPEERTTTWTTTSTPLYDCSQQESCSVWSEARRNWCYWQGGVICSQGPGRKVTTTTMYSGFRKRYNCKDVYSNWESGWSKEKTEWCCMHEGRGCYNDVQGVGVLPGKAMNFERRYDAEEPRPKAPAEERKESPRRGTHWLGVVGLAAGAAMLLTLLVVRHFRLAVYSARSAGYDDVHADNEHAAMLESGPLVESGSVVE